MFIKKTSKEVLLEYYSQDYEILFEEGKELPFLLIYKMLKSELETLKEYINSSLRKGQIRELASRAIALVLYILKKDRTKRLYINYRRLNRIIIKDRYLLPLA